jgi:hypothetical protein
LSYRPFFSKNNIQKSITGKEQFSFCENGGAAFVTGRSDELNFRILESSYFK